MKEDAEQQSARRFTLLLAQDGAERQLSERDYEVLSQALPVESLTQADRDAYRRAWGQEDATRAMVDYYRVSGYGPPHDGRPGFGDYVPDVRDKTIEVPTLVIHSEDSPFARPATLDGLEELVPDLRLHRIPDRSHWLHEQEPEKVNRLIREFFDG